MYKTNTFQPVSCQISIQLQSMIALKDSDGSSIYIIYTYYNGGGRGDKRFFLNLINGGSRKKSKN